MDGPNVNGKDLNSQLPSDADHQLLTVGRYGMHTVHNAFRAGAGKTGWDLLSAFALLYWLLKDFLAYRLRTLYLPLGVVYLVANSAEQDGLRMNLLLRGSLASSMKRKRRRLEQFEPRSPSTWRMNWTS